MNHRFPKLVAFDLDYTLWDLWIDTHVTPPFKRAGNTLNSITDKYGQEIAFYDNVPQILHRLQSTIGTSVAACSRTDAPALARRALDLLLVPPSIGSHDVPKRAVQFFDHLEIYPGSKIAHFTNLHKTTGIPYAQMLFFDDEKRNKEVESLGVTFIHTPDGLDNEVFEKGLKEWRKWHYSV